MLPAIFIMSGLSADFVESIVFYAVIAIPAILIGIVVARLSIALPAIALNVPDFGLGDAWRATAGNGLRLLVVTSLPILPLSLLSWGLELFGADRSDIYQSGLVFILMHFLLQTVDFAFGLIGLTVLSLTYAYFVENKEAGGIRALS